MDVDGMLVHRLGIRINREEIFIMGMPFAHDDAFLCTEDAEETNLELVLLISKRVMYEMYS